MPEEDSINNNPHIEAGKEVNVSELEEELREAARQGLTPEQRYDQRISLAMGMTPRRSTVTREFMEKIVKENRG